MTKNIDLDALEAAAKKALRGPWLVNSRDEDIGKNWTVCSLGRSGIDDRNYEVTTDQIRCSEYDGDAATDAVHIANCDPQTILALVRAVRAAMEFEPQALTQWAATRDRMLAALAPFRKEASDG